MNPQINILSKVPEIFIVLTCIAISIGFMVNTSLTIMERIQKGKLSNKLEFVKDLSAPHECYYKEGLDKKLEVITELDKKFAIAIVKMDMIYDFQVKNSEDVKDALTDHAKRIAKLENKFSTLLAISESCHVIDDDTKG